jgi:RHS repeat-associated protein
LFNSGTVEYTFDLQGHVLTRTNSGSIATAYIPIAGRLWGAIYTASGNTRFMHADWLGSARAYTELDGSLQGTCQTLPFGDARNCTVSTDDDYYAGPMWWNGDDSLYLSQTRSYNPSQAVWATTDPAGMAAVDLTNPQSWNRYAYVLNNPVSFTDPKGLNPGQDCWYCGGGGAPIVDGLPDFSIGLLGGNSMAACPFKDCSNLRVDANGQWQQWQWVAPYTINFGSVTNTSCTADTGVCSGDVTLQHQMGHYDLVSVGSTNDQAVGDVFPPMAQQLFQNNQALWQQSSMTVNRLAGATAVLAAPAVVAGEGATAVIQTGQSLLFNPSFSIFATDAISGATPLTTAPASPGGLVGLGIGWLINEWSDQ